MPGLILQAVVANRYIMREIPRLLRQLDATITHAIGDVLLKSAMANLSHALQKITALLQLEPELYPI